MGTPKYFLFYRFWTRPSSLSLNLWCSLPVDSFLRLFPPCHSHSTYIARNWSIGLFWVKNQGWSSTVTQQVKDKCCLCSNSGCCRGAGLVPSLGQWVKDLLSQLQLGFDAWSRNFHMLQVWLKKKKKKKNQALWNKYNQRCARSLHWKNQTLKIIKNVNRLEGLILYQLFPS